MTPAGVDLARVVSVLRTANLLTGIRGTEDVAVLGVAQDSRRVREGDLFLAWRGVDADGHDFLAEAVTRGAVAAVVERPVPGADLPQLVVTDGRRAAALVADLVLGSPWKELVLVGVTGTNGKSTTTFLIRHLLAADRKSAALGTLGIVGGDGRIRPGTEGLTTPGPVELTAALRAMADEGVEAVVMEASSHALEQRRLDGVRFRVGVFTNLTQDHLDFHGDLERYRAAKLRLAELLVEDGVAVVNAGDPAWREVDAPAVIRFGTDDQAEVVARGVEAGAQGTRFTLGYLGEQVGVDLPLPGLFNVENGLAAAGAALALGLPLAVVAERLGQAPQVPGRLEIVVREPFTVVIDFAHTPAALDNVLATLRPLARGRLVALFGAGGDRDAAKRRPMAEAAARWADRVWLTSDNPRSENPEAILDDLEPGLAGVEYRREADRRRAIHGAVAEAEAGDLVLLAGKGHERYQIVGSERRPFDEREVVQDALAARGVA